VRNLSYKEKGLWVAEEIINEKGEVTGFKVVQQTLSQTQYDTAKKEIETLTERGYKPAEEREIAKKEEKIDNVQGDK